MSYKINCWMLLNDSLFTHIDAYTSFVSIISTSSGASISISPGVPNSGKYLSQNQSLILPRPFLVQKSPCTLSSKGSRSKSARKNLGPNSVGKFWLELHCRQPFVPHKICPISSLPYTVVLYPLCPGENLSYIKFSLYCWPITSCPISDPQCIC